MVAEVWQKLRQVLRVGRPGRDRQAAKGAE